MLTLYIYIGAIVFWLVVVSLSALLLYFVIMFVLYSIRAWRIYTHPYVGGRVVGGKLTIRTFFKSTWLTLGEASYTRYGGVYFPLLRPLIQGIPKMTKNEVWFNNNWQVTWKRAKTGAWSTRAMDFPNRPVIHRLWVAERVIKNVRVTSLIIGPFLFHVMRKA